VPNVNYDECLLKHYVRRHGWLPLCRERLKLVRQAQTTKTNRRIRYFTFCAVGAVDVLMLDIARIVIRSDSGRFDNVVFFDKAIEDVEKTLKSIPGAIGYPGDFLNTVLLEDNEEDNVVSDASPLESIVDEEDTSQTRGSQRLKAIHRQFIAHFPYDALNFDLEGFFFKPNDPMPGKMVRAFRKIFEWQKRTGIDGQGKGVSINSFSLMFTTQVGPPNLTEDYLSQLEECLQRNLDSNSNLRTAFSSKVGHEDVERLRGQDFNLFFKLGMPKVLASILKETGWIVDSDKGITIYEFSRPSISGPYQMLHLMMQVKRQAPHLPGAIPTQAEETHARVIQKLFQEEQIVVTDDLIEPQKSDLQTNLDAILARRQKYSAAEY